MKIGSSIAAVLVLLFVTHSARALDPAQPFSRYIQTRFTTDNGLATNVVAQLLQSPDGFLWILLNSGNLVRFDGRRFTTLPLADQANWMEIGPDNNLWVTTTGGLIE